MKPNASLRDQLGARYEFRQDPRTGTWWGRCPGCECLKCSVGLLGVKCEDCGLNMSLEKAFALLDLGPDPTDDDTTPVFATLAELLERPELLKPPECVVPRLAYRGRCVLLAGPDKSGKSTLLAHAGAKLSHGHTWLGEATTQGRVVHLGLEEALGDAVRRYADLGADPERVQLVTMAPPDLLARTSALLDSWPADLLVVDSLAEWARVTMGQAPDDGDASGWGAIVRPLVALARQHNLAVVLLHHVRRSDGQARGSGEILAAVDATYELQVTGPSEDPTLRRIRGRGRWPIEPYSVVYTDGRYGLAGGGVLSLDALVLIHVEGHPGASKNNIRQAVQGRATAVDAAVARLIERGAIENRGTSDRPQYFTPSPQVEIGDGEAA